MNQTVKQPSFELNTKRYSAALAWATELHQTQKRKGTEIPYVSHLLAVSSLVLEAGGNEDQAIGGLLHDAIEDTDATEADIEERFGKRVADIVVACSETDRDSGLSWKERKESYIEHLQSERTPHEALLVSAADKVHNARSILTDYRQSGEELWERFNSGKEGQLWYYGRLAEVFSEQLDGNWLADELVRTVAEIRAV